MNYATFAALTHYDTPAAALAAKPTNGQAWLMNETKIFQDGRMPKAGPASVKKVKDVQYAGTLTPTINRNKTVSAEDANRTAGQDIQSTKGGGTWVNRVTAANTKGPMIRHKVAWYVTDSNAPGGYRRVFGILEDPTTTNAYRDDDAQVRK